MTASPLSPPPVAGQWQDIASAPKDGSYIIAVVAPNDSRHLRHFAGRAFVIRHEGTTMMSGYDMGWAVYPGYGGAADHMFSHWMPLPAPPLPATLATESGS